MITLLKRMRGHLTIGIMTVGTLFCFMLVAADRVSASTFQTVNGEVVIEAENYTRLGGTTGGTWYLNNEITGYRGSGYIQSATDDPTTLDFSSSIIRAEYDIDFKETGTYYLHLRTYATDHSNNGFFAAVDGQSFDYGHPDAYYIAVYWMNQWWWYNDGGGAGARGYKVSINITKTGVQKLALYRRDKGTRIDRIWLTKHEDVPQDTGTLTLTDPSIFLSSSSAPFLWASFDAGSEEFTYSDDAFRSTQNPAYASGIYDAWEGYSGGGLRVSLGGLDFNDRLGMSGGWSSNFNVSSAGTVSISLRYQLVHAGAFEPDECAEVLVAVDGTEVSDGPHAYLERYCGIGNGSPDQDSGWREAVIDVLLASGGHTITVGGYLNKKTGAKEVVDVYFDDILIMTDAIVPAYESNCEDGVDNDGDGLIDCDDPDCQESSNCEPPPPNGSSETDCGDGIDNDGDGLIDCADSDCSGSADCQAQLFSFTFDAGSEEFTYSDDAFRSTRNPAYASGIYDAWEGYSGGGLRVSLGGLDFNDRLGMSGGWSSNFNVSSAGTVSISLRYQLVHAGAFEPDECAEVLVAVDGTEVSDGPHAYLERYCGIGNGSPDQDSGWREAVIDVLLASGGHTITVGGYLNKKTGAKEVVDVYFDDILIMTDAIVPAYESNCEDGVDNDGDGLIDCDDPDCQESSNCEPPPPNGSSETDCGDGIDNDGDGLIDCADSDCSGSADCQAQLFSFTFDAGSEEFTYSDDAFRSTRNPAYASGIYDAWEGYSGGGLRVSLGGLDFNDRLGMSGGWSSNFNVSSAGTVSISLRYQLVHAGAFEPDECAEVLVAVDGTEVSDGPHAYLERYCGIGNGSPDQDSGWREAVIDVLLASGGHTITVGGYLNKKTGAKEVVDVYFDDIMIQQTDTTELFIDDFQDGSADRWVVVNDAGKSANWQVVDGTFTQLNDRVDNWLGSYHLGSYAYLTEGMSLTDYQVRLNLKSHSQNSGLRDSIGVMVRYEDNNNYIRFLMSRMQGFLRLESRVKGQFKTLCLSGQGIDLGKEYEVSIDIRCEEEDCGDGVDNDGDGLVDGVKILVYLDDEPLFGAEDVGPAGGSIALFTQSKAEFDNLSISTPSMTPQVVIQQPVAHSVARSYPAATSHELSVSAQTINVPASHGIKFSIDEGMPNEIIDFTGSASGIFSNVPKGDRTVVAAMVDQDGEPINDPLAFDGDVNAGVGVGGKYFVGFGDSITNGVGDDHDEDNDAANGKNLNRGYIPVLNNLLSNALGDGTAVFIANEGLGGTTTKEGRDRLAETIARYPDSQIWLILFGTNDSAGILPVPSGVNCQEPGSFDPAHPDYSAACRSTFKGYLRDIVLHLKSEGKLPVLAQVPYLKNAPTSRVSLLFEYNQVVRDLHAFHQIAVETPDFYGHFSDPANQDHFFDNTHPNGNGYIDMANLWYEKLINSPLFD